MLNIKLYVQILQNIDILFKYYLLSYYMKISEKILNIELKIKMFYIHTYIFITELRALQELSCNNLML